MGPIGAARFVGLQPERSGDDYTKAQNKIFEGMSVEEIYEEAIRLESEREGKQDPKG